LNIYRTDIFESLSLIVSSSPAVAIDGRLIGTRNRTHDRPLTHANQTVSSSLSRNRGTCRRDNFGGTPQLWRTEQNSDFVEAVSPIGDGGTRACRSKPRARRAVATWTACENGAYQAVFADDEIIEFMGKTVERERISSRERRTYPPRRTNRTRRRKNATYALYAHRVAVVYISGRISPPWCLLEIYRKHLQSHKSPPFYNIATATRHNHYDLPWWLRDIIIRRGDDDEF